MRHRRPAQPSSLYQHRILVTASPRASLKDTLGHTHRPREEDPIPTPPTPLPASSLLCFRVTRKVYPARHGGSDPKFSANVTPSEPTNLHGNVYTHAGARRFRS